MPDDRGPIPNSYALLDGRLIAGEYPGDRHDSPASVKLGTLLDAGVRTFVDLTEAHELRPYHALLACEAKARGAEATHVRIPIRDLSVPQSPDVMHEILNAIDHGLRAGGKVYVHCWGGVGRTGTVIGCHLVRLGMSGDEALARVGTLFKSMEKYPRRNRSPETDEQEAFVRAWHDSKAPNARVSTVALPGDEAQRDRIRGALIGLAVGDAVGTTVEFKTPGTFKPVTHMVGGGPFNLRPGQWTDDTSMALCLAESLIECGGFNARDQMERYVRWWREGHLSSTGKCFDIGNTTRAALARFERTGDPYAGPAEPNTVGNGSLMRLAPVAMFYASRAEEGIARCGESSRTTHGAREAVDACRYLGGLLIGAMNGAPKEELVSPLYSPVPGLWEREPLTPKIAEVASGSFARRSPPEIAGTGYVVKSLEAALWAFATTENYRDGCLEAVNLGDDADTTAAIYGQVAGAHYGESAIPREWREQLALVSVIDRLADSLSRATGC
jgi:ADP-ribosyl-[dinitrogen reductase] hydrolase